jgi:hypothetical protein
MAIYEQFPLWKYRSDPQIRLDLLAIAGIVSSSVYHAFLDFGVINPDAVSYLEMARAMASGDWDTAANATWSPGLPIFLALIFAVFPVPLRNEPLVATALGLLICLAISFISMKFCHAVDRSLPSDARLAKFSTRITVYGTVAVCAWYVNPAKITSDLQLLGITLLIATQIFHFWRKEAFHFPDACRIGLLGGLGYLFKQSYLPVVILAATLSLRWAKPQQWPRLAAGILFCFFCIMAPWAGFLSHHRERITIGDNGRWNYVEFVNGIDHYFWRSVPEEFGRPLHPPQLIDSRTETYLYKGRLQTASLPLHYDLAWWADGEIPKIDLLNLQHQFYLNLQSLAAFFKQKAVIVILLTTAWLLVGTKQFDPGLYMKIVAIAFWLPVAFYLFVHIEPRHMVPFLCVSLCLALSGAIQNMGRRQLIIQTALGSLIVFSGFYDSYRNHQGEREFPIAKVASELDSELRRQSVPANANVVVLSTVAKLDHSFYSLPRFARFRIAGLVLNESRFQSMADSEREQYYKLLRSEGIRAIVASRASISPNAVRLFSHSSNHVLIHTL